MPPKRSPNPPPPPPLRPVPPPNRSLRSNVWPRRRRRPAVNGPNPPPRPRAQLVVLLALLGVADDVVGLGDRLEPLLGGLVAGVGVGVVGTRELAVGLLDVGRRRVLGDAEDLVEVLVRPVRAGHPRTPSLRRSVVAGRARSAARLAGSVAGAGRARGRPRSPAPGGRRGRRSGSRPETMFWQVVVVTSGECACISASWSRGSNSSPGAPNFTSPCAGDDPLERVGDGLEAALELAVLAGPVDVVEHRQQRGQHRELGVLLAPARGRGRPAACS